MPRTVNQTDLFGDAGTVIEHIRAYAGKPGAGPTGKVCKDCKHYCRVGGHSRAYLKCGLMRSAWTKGPGTDIKASTPACDVFKPKRGIEDVKKKSVLRSS